MLLKSVFIFLSLFLFSCSSTQKNIPDPNQIYSAEFLKKIEAIKDSYKTGSTKTALTSLEKLKDSNLSEVERGLKYNLIGVIEFADGRFDIAEKNFNQALKLSDKDKSLVMQIHLNLASTYFKQLRYEKSHNELKLVDVSFLSEVEEQKFFNLKLALATQLKLPAEAMEALVSLNLKAKSFDDFKLSPQASKLYDYFSQLSETEKIRFMEKYEATKPIIIRWLGHKEGNHLISLGAKDKAKEILLYTEEHFGADENISQSLANIQDSKVDYADFEGRAIGIILPLSGDKESFGRKAMMGVELGLAELFPEEKAVLYTKDSKSSPVVGAESVRELIETNHVSVIIGGLFPDEALEEYLEAKKRGIMFVSLSNVSLPRDQKDKYLIEISASVESQIDAVTSEKILKSLGAKIGLFYPETPAGIAYANELFRVASNKGFTISEVQSYKKDAVDFRDPVEKMLSLKYPAERKHELEYLSNIYSLEKNVNIKRVQVLGPIVDFDWLYIPAFPNEAMQIIPLFSYYDATHLKYVGGPSWRSELMKKNQPKIGNVTLVGEDADHFSAEFGQKFFDKYKSYPKLVETMAYDAMKVGHNLLVENKIEDRSDLNDFLDGANKVKGFTGEWAMKEGLWIKELVAQKITQGNFIPIE